ncbi:MAG TPA: glycosyltransferase family 39 protein [Ktedonobacteraceae bacterium]|nr:glycosyltransferase family 39 protein [Ktedonobacteraceae bacterium]
MNNQTRALGGVTLLTLLGFALRFFRLNTVPLRGDEAFTVIHWMREPLAHTLSVIATVDPQGPLSYALFRGWGLVMGTNEGVVRILPALISVIGVPVIYALGHRLRGQRFGLLAAFFWAINPDQIWHAQDARNYAIWAVLSALAIWLALRALDRQRRLDWLLYIVAGALAAYVYYLELFVIVVLNLYVFITCWRNRKLLVRWIGAELAVGLLLAPWYLQPRLLFQSGYGGTAGHFDPPQLITRFIPTLMFGMSLPPDFVAGIAPILVIILLLGLTLWLRHRWQQGLLVGMLGIVPLLFLGIVSLRLNVFEPRYVLAAAPAYVLVLVSLILSIDRRFVVIVVLVFAAVLLVSGFDLSGYYFPDDYAKAKAPDWRALASYLHDHVSARDWITQASADASFVFYCGEYQVQANCDDQLPANPLQSQQEIDRLLTMRSEQHPAIWYVADPPPGWPNKDDAENWLTANLQPVRSTSADGLRVQEFKPWTVTLDEISGAPLATFGDAAQLVGAQSWIEPTNEVTVWLYWRALKPTGSAQKVFLHLTQSDGTQIVTQEDQYPQAGRIDTTSWQTGTVYRDVYTLPLNGVTTGTYKLIVGFYDPQTNRRLPVGDGDSFTIQSISVP